MKKKNLQNLILPAYKWHWVLLLKYSLHLRTPEKEEEETCYQHMLLSTFLIQQLLLFLCT